MSQKINLTAAIAVNKVEGKAGFLSHIIIKQGVLHVAHAKLVGKYNEQQALAAFKREPNKFTPAPKFVGVLNVLALALAA